MANGQPKTANELAEDRTDLAIERTAMAANRTLMAWIRTALSLISFGFTIYKVLEAVVKAEGAEKIARMNAHGPRRLGLFLIALGTLSVVLGSVEYFGTIKRLNRQSTSQHNPLGFSFIVGIAIGLLGLTLLVTIMANIEVL